MDWIQADNSLTIVSNSLSIVSNLLSIVGRLFFLFAVAIGEKTVVNDDAEQADRARNGKQEDGAPIAFVLNEIAADGGGDYRGDTRDQ